MINQNRADWQFDWPGSDLRNSLDEKKSRSIALLSVALVADDVAKMAAKKKLFTFCVVCKPLQKQCAKRLCLRLQFLKDCISDKQHYYNCYGKIFKNTLNNINKIIMVSSDKLEEYKISLSKNETKGGGSEATQLMKEIVFECVDV